MPDRIAPTPGRVPLGVGRRPDDAFLRLWGPREAESVCPSIRTEAEVRASRVGLGATNPDD